MVPRSDTRARMVRSALHLFRRHGYQGTSLINVVEADGLPRGSIYFHFRAGKEDLGIEVASATRRFHLGLLSRLAASCADAGEFVEQFFATFASEMESNGCEAGCPVAPIVVEALPASVRLHAACKETFHDWHEAMAEVFVSYGLPSERATRLSGLVIASLEGGMLLARVEGDAGPLRSIGSELAATIGAGKRGRSRAGSSGGSSGTTVPRRRTD